MNTSLVNMHETEPLTDEGQVKILKLANLDEGEETEITAPSRSAKLCGYLALAQLAL